MPNGHGHDDSQRLMVDLGIAGVVIATLIGLHVLAFDSALGESIPRVPRSLFWLILSLGCFHVSGNFLFTYEEEHRGLPMARWSTSIGGCYLLGCALYDLLVPLNMPIYPLPFLLFGLAALAASAWCDSTLMALVGTEFIDYVVASQVAAYFGYLGGFSTSAVFFHIAFAAVEVPLGFWVARNYRRGMGLGILANGSFSVIRGLLFLGTYGVGVHNCPSQTWIHIVYLALALALSIYFARLMTRISEGGIWDYSSRTVVYTVSYICDRLGMPDNLSWMVGIFAYYALEASGVFGRDEDQAGVQLNIEPGQLDDPAMLQALLEQLAEADPARARWSRTRQARAVGRFLLGTCLGYTVLVLLCFGNRAISSEESFRIRVQSRRVEARISTRVEELHMPDGLRRGQRLDGYLLPYEVDRYKMLFTDLFVVPAGTLPPDDVDISKARKLTGRYYRYRRYDGKSVHGIVVNERLFFDISEEWQRTATKGDHLVFAAGGFGYAYPDHVQKADGGVVGDAVPDSWVLGGGTWIPIEGEEDE